MIVLHENESDKNDPLWKIKKKMLLKIYKLESKEDILTAEKAVDSIIK